MTKLATIWQIKNNNLDIHNHVATIAKKRMTKHS